MSGTVPAQLALSGKVHPSQSVFASVGDVAVHPGGRRTAYIDATMFDGTAWRMLDISGFGFQKNARAFDQASQVGPLMRRIESSIARCAGELVHYEVPAGGRNRKYVYKGGRILPRTWADFTA